MRALSRVALALVLAQCVGLAACSDGPPKEARRVDPIIRDTPQVFRGVVGSETTINGIEPVLVSGLGLIVGLNGTGGGPYPAAVQSTMERELARGGIGVGGAMSEGPLAGKSPRAVLADPNVAVVLVEGAIPPGAPDGAPFDVVVRTFPGSAVSSLEGGTLWTTELRVGPATPFGAARTRKLAEARGPVFLNPFAEPGRQSEASRRTIGRVLHGGVVTDGLAMEIRLDNPSHARAASIAGAINNRFQIQPGVVDEPPARGRSASSIALRVPRGWADKPDEFIRIVQYTQIDQSFPEEFAKRYVDEMAKQPAIADELAWCVVALGRPALSFVNKLYDFPEPRPRMAGLRAGAMLGDPRAMRPLAEIASGRAGMNPTARAEAIELLGRLPLDPAVNMALRELVDARELEIRVAAYEALAARGDPSISRRVFERKFVLDQVQSADPLIYVRQQGQPRIVLFGDPLPVKRPSMVSAWSGRFMLVAEEDAASAATNTARVFYRDYRTGEAVRGSVAASAASLIEWLATAGSQADSSEPAQGAGLTYSQVVGALYEAQRAGALPGAFSTERDRLMARLLSAQQSTAAVEDRPETESDRDRVREEAQRGADERVAPATPAPAGDSVPTVVPLNPDGSPRTGNPPPAQAPKR